MVCAKVTIQNKNNNNNKVHTVFFLAGIGSFSGFSSRLEKLPRNKNQKTTSPKYYLNSTSEIVKVLDHFFQPKKHL